MVMQASKRPGAKAAACCSGLQGLLSSKLFKALSEPRRLTLLVRMAESRSELTVGEIAKGSGVDMSVVSRHLGILREAGVICCDKQGKEVRCVVQVEVLVKMLRDLANALEACCPRTWQFTADSEGATPRAKGTRVR